MIVDESDERMFNDLDAFYSATKSDKVFTIRLTATPYDGDEKGLQAATLDEIGYKIYHNSDKKEDYIPRIHQTLNLGGDLDETLLRQVRNRRSPDPSGQQATIRAGIAILDLGRRKPRESPQFLEVDFRVVVR